MPPIYIFPLLLTVVMASTFAQSAPMKFSSGWSGGNCVGCEWTQATGVITPETPALFEKMVKDEMGVGYTLVLDSEGGDLASGLELGRLFRKYDINVAIGKTVLQEGSTKHHTTVDEGKCVSACAYAFLGGTRRSIENDNEIGFHQFYDDSDRAGAASVVTTGAEQLFESAIDQYITGLIVQYINEMGIQAELYPIAASVRPDEIRYLTTTEAVELGISNVEDVGGPWNALPFGDRGLLAEFNTLATNRTLRLYCAVDGKHHLTLLMPLNRLGDEAELRNRYESMGNSFEIDASGQRVPLRVTFVGTMKKTKRIVVVTTISAKGARALALANNFKVVSGENFNRASEGAFYIFQVNRILGGQQIATQVLRLCI